MSDIHETPRTLSQDISDVLNRHSRENASGTPDFILAQFMVTCLQNLEKTIADRAEWRGEEVEFDPSADIPEGVTLRYDIGIETVNVEFPHASRSRIFRIENKVTRKSAMIFDGSEESAVAILEWMNIPGDAPKGYYTPEDERLNILTLEGEMHAWAGSYIIKGLKGEFYPCKPDIFDQSYNVISS